MNTSPLFAPDGMRVSGATAERLATLAETSWDTRHNRLRELMDIVLPHERDDDGLVHNHTWATRTAQTATRTTNGSYLATAASSHGQPSSAVRKLMDIVLPHDRHDDGLVHNHGWAASAA